MNPHTPPLTDYAKGVVLPDYTDEALRAGGFLGDETTELLLLVPAEQRQNVAAEAHNRTTRVVTHWTESGTALQDVRVTGDYVETVRDILREQGWLR
jgi:hypothetical protein